MYTDVYRCIQMYTVYMYLHPAHPALCTHHTDFEAGFKHNEAASSDARGKTQTFDFSQIRPVASRAQ